MHPALASMLAASITFADIAPVLYQHCAPCHREEGAAPFALTSYRDAARHAAQIAAAAKSRFMPPWKPEQGYGAFAGERRLSPSQIEMLQAWAAAGAPEGDPRRAPQPPVQTSGWRLGEPDAVARLAREFAVAPDGEDQYRCFAIPLALDKRSWIRAFEFHPGNPKVVHHALLFLDSSGAARSNDHGDGYPCFGAPGFLPVNALGGWTPGTQPLPMPTGVAVQAGPRTCLVLQLHFHPTGKPEKDRSSVGLYLTSEAPKHHLFDIPLGSRQIDIPAGASAYKVRDHFTVPVDVDAIGVIPHAHYICKDMRAWATLPGGARRWLIWIRDWDFNWQEQYRYVAPVRLPADTEIEMEFTYDNSDANPRNPNRPPQRVVWGPGSSDEMAGLHVQVIPRHAADIAELSRALWGKLMRSVGGGFPTR